VAAADLFVLDGDNLVHARGAGADMERARERLAGDVAGYAAQEGVEVVLVFDGHGRAREIGPLRVVHAGRETADTVIERLAHRAGPERTVTVVSNDAVLRHVAQRGGVHAMSAREFLDRLAAGASPPSPRPDGPRRRTIADALPADVRAALERLRRGE
jgi:predicted RNA-binding protein with PIN domain